MSMPVAAMIWSLPVELSLTSTMVCLAPAADRDERVVERLAVGVDHVAGGQRVEAVGVAVEVLAARRRRRSSANRPFSCATCQGNQPGQALKPSVIFVPDGPGRRVSADRAGGRPAAATGRSHRGQRVRFMEGSLLYLRPCGRGRCPARTRQPRVSQMTRVAMSAVISALSYGGEHSTTSMPASGPLGDQLDELEHLAGEEAARLGPAGAGDERGVETVDVEATARPRRRRPRRRPAPAARRPRCPSRRSR